ncbi:MAG: carbohydrate-binding protein, partial [Bacteroidota bacterium]
MKHVRLLNAALLLALPFLVNAQSINYTRSWLGATFDGGPVETVMSFIDKMEVSPDGTVHTFSGWDEAVGGSRTTNSKDGEILNRSGFTIHCHQITDNNGNTWTIMRPSNETDIPYPTGNDSIKCDDGRVITDVDGPTSLAISHDGYLMVGQYGRLSQIRYYDISGTGTPTLVRTFGDSLGYLSGNVPGRLGNLRFREIRGVGEDEEGNIYVGMSSFFGGCKLQSYTQPGRKNWELNGLMFVDNGDIDPATDGRDIYTKSHHFAWDSTKAPGQEWIDTAYTLNRYDFPDDSRLFTVTRNPTVTTHPSSTWIRYIDGQKFMIVNDMYTEQFRMYRFDSLNGETAIPSLFYARWNLLPWVGNVRDFKINDNATVLATDFDDRHGTNPGTTEVGGIQAGQWLAYDGIDFGTTDTSTFTVNYSCTDPWPACRIDIHADSADGRIIGKLQTARTGGNDIFKLFTSKLSDTITGIHRIVLIMQHPTPNIWPSTQPTLGQWLWSDADGDGTMDADEYQNIEQDNYDLKTL